MNPLHGLLVIVLGTILLQFSTVEAIQCYECQSHIQPDCLNQLSAKFLKNCSEQAGGPKFEACRRIENSIDGYTYLGQKLSARITRQCAASTKSPKGGSYVRSGFGSKTSVHECFINGCNTAASVLCNSFILMMVPFVAFFNYRS